MVFEGSDGAGKSTQIKLLAQKLATEGRKVVLLREPGGTEPGEEMRHILKHGNYNLSPRAELLLMNASRAQLVDAVILPALARGEDVLLDRFFYSTIAYQGYGRNLPLPTVRSVINAAVGELQPDHVFLLRIPLEVAWSAAEDARGYCQTWARIASKRKMWNSSPGSSKAMLK
jgi:dTMP kinase